ncbi:MAG: leucine-rich repeat domain-containing protein [Paludibacteraceae bacterium]|nr:leucine-rich repeat domain-containing protein [Paludibacteraceae bacterium]
MKTINSLRSKLLALTLALMAGVASFAYDEMSPDFKVDGLYYNFLEGDNVEVTHPYRPEMPTEGTSTTATQDLYDDYAELTELTIPSTISYEGKVYNVIRIGYAAFDQCNLTYVDIPSSIKTIGVGAFSNCSSLTSITLKEGLEHIEGNAFADCRLLETITFPNSLKTVGSYAFSFTAWYNNQPNGGVYAGNVFYKYKGDIPKNTSFVIKEGTISISPDAFIKENRRIDYGLVAVAIPNSVEIIGEYAFSQCRALRSVNIPSRVTTIESYAFSYCKSLTSVTSEIVEPLSLPSDVFFKASVANATLYVPAESVEAYKNADQWKDFGQVLPIAENPEDLFPTLWGLQRTSCTKTIGEDEYGTVWGSRSYLMQEIETATIGGKQYLLFGTNNIYDEYCSLWLREENNKILLYSTAQKKDLVLYDFTLNVGDSLPRLYVDYDLSSVVDYDNDEWGLSPLVVTEVSTITLLDGKEYKKWTFDNGMQYVEGIGSFGTCYAHNDFYQLIANGPLLSDVHSQHLVCASKNGQLLYKMDEAEMERLGAECLCDVEKKWSDTWCNQWNILSHGYQGPQDPLVAACTSIFWLSNNTVNRDGQEYIPLMCSSSMPEVESTTLIGELRFTEDKQVYFNYDNTEYLLYDFDVQVGDTLDIFGGIELYSYSFVEQKTYPHVITKIDTLDDGRLQITSDAIVIFEDGEVGTFEEKQQQIWIEGLGSINGILHTGINPGIGGNPAIVMLCAYRDDECVYKTDSNNPYWIDYTQLGCVYNAGDFIEGAFPMLSGLQRTVCKEYYGETEDDNSANSTYKQTFDQIFFENDKPYILCNDYLLREEDNKILIYSQLLNKDLVLYDFTLEVGDSLPALYIDYHARNAMDWMPYNLDVVDYYKSFDGTIYPADTFIVTDISNVTLFDGKEYKKWTFNNGVEYVEGIGGFGNRQWSGDFFQLIANRDVPTSLQGEHLVCASRNGQLLYKMDDAKMERLGAECLCDYNSGPKKDNAKNGKIGGRPTPTQWNMLEVETKEMDGTPTILRAETFSYTLENDSIVTKGKTYYQLARQSTKDTAITKSFVGALHFGEDEDNRVYFLRDGVEYVLYDFTAEPGDTIEIFAGINNYPQYTTYTHVVTGKDTLENGACRMILEVVFPEETSSVENAQKVWLAGLGSIDGIVHNAASRATKARSSDTQTSVMLCAWRDDDCLYTTDHPDYDSYGCVYNLPTSIKDIETPGGKCQKLIRDGHLYILRDNKLYDVLGTPLN